ncbi:MAG: hypothetical protein RMJ66_05230 [Bacteroidia bacterium]|nr:hypothetical protein [Bacteroidia bacterium]
MYWGRGLYGLHHYAQVRLLRSVDGRKWYPITKSPQLSLPHATETDFWIEPDGWLWAITRAEGYGSYLSYASRGCAKELSACASGVWKLSIVCFPS